MDHVVLDSQIPRYHSEKKTIESMLLESLSSIPGPGRVMIRPALEASRWRIQITRRDSRWSTDIGPEHQTPQLIHDLVMEILRPTEILGDDSFQSEDSPGEGRILTDDEAEAIRRAVNSVSEKPVLVKWVRQLLEDREERLRRNGHGSPDEARPQAAPERRRREGGARKPRPAPPSP